MHFSFARAFIVSLLAVGAASALDALPDRLINISTRGETASGNDSLIAGFVISGGDSKRVLIRAAGPALTPFGVSGTLANPRLTLFDSTNTAIASNDDWSSADAAMIASVGAFPFASGSTDAALVTTLAPGSYTAQVSPPAGSSSTGVSLVEVYEIDGTAKLINLSTRGRVTATQPLIAGIVVPAGSTRRVLIRAAGPALAPFGVTGALANPRLTLLNAASAVVATNDDWAASGISTMNAASTTAGAFAFVTGSADSALIADLAPGSHTVHVNASAGTATDGVALVEAYDITGFTPPATDVVRMTDASGVALASYPLQLGHAFLPGEIADTPTLFANGVAIASQAEITHRWGDGSARFAKLSAVVPAVAANGSVSLSFGSTAAPATSSTTITALLAQFPDFDCTMTFTQSGVTRTASARAMLAAGAAEWLARGPVCHELRVADHATRTYDFGFDAYRPLRPTFYVSFWPTLGKVRVRCVVESPNLDALKEVPYDVAVTLGVSSPVSVYSKSGVTQWFGSRWTKTFWQGGTPEQRVNLHTDLAHLAQTGFVPNYDPAFPPTEAQIASQWSYWQTSPRDLYDPGFWTRYMPTTGGRGDIGPVPAWMELWLSSGDWRAREVALSSADLAGAWSLNFREHNSALFFDREHTVAGNGRPMSLNGHPNLWFPTNNGIYEGMIPGARGDGNWVPDGAHQPDPFSVPYLLTGDMYYLESMQLWAATQTFAYPYGQYGRGLDGYGAFQDQVRGNGWVIRNRALAAALSPDGSAERRYFSQLCDDVLAFWSGQRGIVDPYFTNHPNRVWAATNRAFDWSPLRFWLPKDTGNRKEGCWQDFYFMTELGFARDLGIPVDGILSEFSKVVIGQVTTPGYNPMYLGLYYSYVIDDSDAWLPSWSAYGAFNLAKDPAAITSAIASFGGTGDPAFAVQAACAGSVVTRYPGGDATWGWFKTNVIDAMTSSYGSDYRRWRLLPHETAPPAPTTFALWQSRQAWGDANSASSADPDGDGRTNLTEYALGSSPIVADAALAPTTAGGNLSLTFTLDPRKTDIACVTERTSDGSTWTSVASTLNSASGYVQTRTVTIPVASSAGIRLRVVTR